MTLTERKSRYEIIIKIPNHHALQNVVDEHARYFKTITFDNGSEFKLLNQVQGLKIFIVHPYLTCKRGSDEDQNGLI
ncbi:MAG: hypothetical protein ABF518_08680 [Liquorilactobacillus ghanensis]